MNRIESRPIILDLVSKTILPADRKDALKTFDFVIEACKEMYRNFGGIELGVGEITVRENKKIARITLLPDQEDAGNALRKFLEQGFAEPDDTPSENKN